MFFVFRTIINVFKTVTVSFDPSKTMTQVIIEMTFGKQIMYLQHNRYFNKKKQELLLVRSCEHRELGRTAVALSSTSEKQ